MPELPEVEHLRRTLARALTGRTVAAARLLRRDICESPNGRVRRADLLEGGAFAEPLRHGKQLALRTTDGRVVCVHLGMSGQLLHLAPGERPARSEHVHALWKLEGGGRLLFRDPRRFGGLWTFPSLSALESSRWSRLGPDAASIAADELGERLARTTRPIKAALLDQEVLAGVGNIYADEALFLARVRPQRRADSLTGAEVERLTEAIRATLERAIEAGGSTLRDYLDAGGNAGRYQFAHLVYGRGGQPCRSCGRTLESDQTAQRTTVFCVSCQE